MKKDFTSRAAGNKIEPIKRVDGEMYARPVPNPFTSEWHEGYHDALEERPRAIDEVNYNDGYECGLEALQEEREELDRLGSSNA